MTGPDVAARFQRDTAEHEMTILRDDSLYRHLRFRAPGTSSYWFDLITWPGALVINGDMETFVFARTEDMFSFFRGDRINPGYWGEKLRAPRDARVHSEDLFRECVRDEASRAEADYPGLSDAVQEYFFGQFAEWNPGSESDVTAGLSHFKYLPEGSVAEPFRFTDTWEWDLRDWSYQFLWCCHAIQWGIGQYAALAVAA
jgi:hypothetical protein